METLTNLEAELVFLKKALAVASVTREEAAALLASNSACRILEAYDSRIRELQERIGDIELRSIAEDCLLTVGDNLIDGICVVDVAGRVVSVNRSYAQLTEAPEDEVVGHTVHDLLETGKMRVAVTPRVMQEKKRISVLCASPHSDKTYLITGLPLFDKNGALRGAMTILRDMTEITSVASALGHPEGIPDRDGTTFKLVEDEPTRQARLIGENQKVRKIKELVRYIARNDSTVLLLGETGTGKEVVSREIHEMSPRAQKPYIRINCGALPESLIESELFGYERGAFTGAQNKTKLGIFEQASGGTLLLDEITDLPLPLQSKLLRVLQEREIRRLGGTRSIPVDVRIIASTNKDFPVLISKGEFRADLYYRLNVVPIRLLPLRERKDDIPLFVKHFLATFNSKYGAGKLIDPAGIDALKQYSWPGNVRELENLIERVVASVPDDHVTLRCIEDLLTEAKGPRTGDTEARPADSAAPLRDNLCSYEKELLANALRTYGSTYKAAKALGVSQSTVFRKAAMYGLLGASREGGGKDPEPSVVSEGDR